MKQIIKFDTDFYGGISDDIDHKLQDYYTLVLEISGLNRKSLPLPLLVAIVDQAEKEEQDVSAFQSAENPLKSWIDRSIERLPKDVYSASFAI